MGRAGWMVLVVSLAGQARADTIQITFLTEPPPTLQTGHSCFYSPTDPNANDNQLVIVWLEEQGTGRYLRTLHRWGQTYVYNFENWAQAADMKVDATTSATPRCFTRQYYQANWARNTCGNGGGLTTADVQLDTGVVDISDLPDGTYEVHFEWSACELGDEYTASSTTYAPLHQVPLTFVKGGADQSPPTTAGSAPIIDINLNYLAGTGDRPPGVEAGADQRVVPAAEARVTLNGLVTDDAGTPTATWSLVNATPAGGQANFIAANDPGTEVTFSRSGIYVLELEADDGSNTATDQMTVYVNARFLVATDDAEVNSNGNNNNKAMGNYTAPNAPACAPNCVNLAQGYSWGDDVGDRSRAYLRFDVSSVSGLVVEHSFIRIPVGGQAINTSYFHDFHLVPDTGDTWTDATLTWNNQPITNGVLSSEPLIGAWRHSGTAGAATWFTVPIDGSVLFPGGSHSNDTVSVFVRPRGDYGFGMAFRENMVNPELVVIEEWDFNSAPTASASIPATAVANAAGSATVSLDGSGSSDPENNITLWEWNEVGGSSNPIATGETTTADLGLGIHDLELYVEDAGGLNDTDTGQVLVDDRFAGNSTFGTAQPVAAGTLDNLFAHDAAGDWFLFTMPAGGTLDVDIAFTHADGNLDLRVYQSDGSTLEGDSVSTTNNENVSLSLAAADYLIHVSATTGDAVYSMTIAVSGVPTLSVSFSPTSVAESAGTVLDIGTVTTDTAPASDLSVALVSSFGDLAPEATVTIPTGVLTVTFDVTVTDDIVPEADATATITASAPGHTPGAGDLTIVDDDDTPPVAVAGVPATATADATGTATVSLDGSGSTDVEDDIVTWEWNEVGGASNPIATGETTTADLGLGFHDIELYVEDSMAGSDTDAATVLVDDRYAGNDASGAAATVVEGAHANLFAHDAAGDWFLVTMPAAGGVDVDIAFTHADGDLNLHVYQDDGTTLEGESITTTDDESVSITGLVVGDYLIHVPATSGNAIYSLTIAFTGVPTLTVTFAQTEVLEGAGTVTDVGTVSLTLDGNPYNAPTDLSVTLSSDDTDLVPESPVTITAGQSSVTFDITVTDDAIEESDATVTVDASAPAHTPGSDTITIRDDDGPLPIVSWSSASQTVSETDGTATVTVTMTATAATDIVVPFTLSGSATGGGVDYQVGATDITITSGDTTADLVFVLFDDSGAEGDEDVVFTLGSPAGASTASPRVHLVTITDDETVVSDGAPSDGGPTGDATAGDTPDGDGTTTGDAGGNGLGNVVLVSSGCACDQTGTPSAALLLVLGIAWRRRRQSSSITV